MSRNTLLRSWTPVLVGAGIALALVIGFAILGSLMEFAERHVGLAAWVQAILSAGAILAAVLLQNRERANARADRLRAVIAIARDSLDVIAAANFSFGDPKTIPEAVTFFRREFEVRVALLRDYDHGSYEAAAVDHVLRLLTVLQTAIEVCDATGSTLAATTTLSGPKPVRPKAFDLQEREADLITQALEEIAGLPRVRGTKVKTSI